MALLPYGSCGIGGRVAAFIDYDEATLAIRGVVIRGTSDRMRARVRLDRSGVKTYERRDIDQKAEGEIADLRPQGLALQKLRDGTLELPDGVRLEIAWSAPR